MLRLKKAYLANGLGALFSVASAFGLVIAAKSLKSSDTQPLLQGVFEISCLTVGTIAGFFLGKGFGNYLWKNFRCQDPSQDNQEPLNPIPLGQIVEVYVEVRRGVFLPLQSTQLQPRTFPNSDVQNSEVVNRPRM